jgi:transcriptional regulator with XRE-family HTH domain
VNTKERKKELTSLLRDKEYRDAFVEASINIGVPSQIRTLRKQRGWTQKILAAEAKMLQESVSRIEDPTRGSINLKTLLKFASAFDLGLTVKFVPFGEMVDRKLKLSLETLEVESFEKDPYFKEDQEPLIIADSTKYSAESSSLATSNNVIFIADYLNPQVIHQPVNSEAASAAFNY